MTVARLNLSARSNKADGRGLQLPSTTRSASPGSSAMDYQMTSPPFGLWSSDGIIRHVMH